MSIWTTFKDVGLPTISKYVKGLESKDTSLVAYYIDDRKKINLLNSSNSNETFNEDDLFIGNYIHLKNNYGIYFLLGDERDKKIDGRQGKKTVYVGQASKREQSRGLDRLKEHMKTGEKQDRYYERWSSALFITSKENDWSTGKLDILEKGFICAFKNHDSYTCLNTPKGTDGNIPEEDYIFALQSIVEILALPLVGYSLLNKGEKANDRSISKCSNDIIAYTVDELKKLMNIELEKYKNEFKHKYSQLTKQEQEDLLWVKRVKQYDAFKQHLANAGEYVKNGRVKFGSSKPEVVTPDSIAKEIVKLIPVEQLNENSTFLDVYCKSGAFIKELINRLMQDNNEEQLPINSFGSNYISKRERLNHIISNQIFAVCNSPELYLIANKMVLDTIESYIDKIHGKNKSIQDNNVILPNIIYINRYRDDIKYDKQGLIDEITKKLGLGSKEVNEDSTSKQEVKSEKSHKENKGMKFDIVVGNPPYNNDIYIDFVQLSQRLSSKYTLMITPAKWQAKGGEKNNTFRKEIVPYMTDIVYYPDTYEIFDVREQSGITYFLADKTKHDSKNIKVICNTNKNLESEMEQRNVDTTLYGESILGIIEKCKIGGGQALSNNIGVKQSEYVDNTEHGYINGSIEIYAGASFSGMISKNELKTTDGLEKWKVITSVMPVDDGFDKQRKVFGLSRTYILKPNTVPKGSFPVLKKFDTEIECKSFQLYCNTKLVRFLYFIGICGKTISEEFWRHIPDQKNWDKIYEDKPLLGYEPDENGEYTDSNGMKHCSLYIKYKLSQDDINLIESVIKAREA